MDAAALGRLIHAQGIDLCYSRFARSAPGLCGFGYITRTGDLSRLAGMGVLAASRRTGVARGLLRHLIEEARARGDRMMVLEVIEQNPPSYALYEKQGFRSLCSPMRLAASAQPSHRRAVAGFRGNFTRGGEPDTEHQRIPSTSVADFAARCREARIGARLRFRPGSCGDQRPHSRRTNSHSRCFCATSSFRRRAASL